jgi:hypothetical protein
MQKNGERGVAVTQHRTIAKPGTGLCPVRALAGVKLRISVYDLGWDQKGEVAARPMNLVSIDERGTRATTITAKKVLVHLSAAAIQYGEARLGFPAGCKGTHSLRAGAAMAMFLAGVPVKTIQLIVR